MPQGQAATATSAPYSSEEFPATVAEDYRRRDTRSGLGGDHVKNRSTTTRGVSCGDTIIDEAFAPWLVWERRSW